LYKRPLAFALPIPASEKSQTLSTAPIAAAAAASTTTVTSLPADAASESAPLLGNPRRIRGLDRSMLERPAPVSTMVGNPRRLRRLDAAAFQAA
jgi:hypothetical protein